MFDSISTTHWHAEPKKFKRSPNEMAYVMFGIMLLTLTVPATIILWAIFKSLFIWLG